MADLYLRRIRSAETKLRAALPKLNDGSCMAKAWTVRCSLALLVLSEDAPMNFLRNMRKFLQAKVAPSSGLSIVRVAEGYGTLPSGGIWQPKAELERVRDGVELAGNSYTPPAGDTCWHSVVWAPLRGRHYTDGRTHTYFSLCGKRLTWLKYGLGGRGMLACKRCIQLENNIVRKEES